MKFQKVLVTSMVLVLLGLSACGQKGDLTLPEPAQKDEKQDAQEINSQVSDQDKVQSEQ